MLAEANRWGLGLLALFLLVACPRPKAGSPGAEGPEAATDPSGRTPHEVKTDDDHTLTVWEKRPAGTRKGVLVLLHGRDWSSLPAFDLQVPGENASLMDRLVEAGYAVYAIDLRGYGASARDQTGFIEPERAVNDVGNVLNWVGIKEDTEAALVGWSYGAMVAMLAAQYFPDHAKALVLMGFPAGLPGSLEEKAAPPQAPMQPNTREAAEADFVTEGALSPAAREAFVAQALEADPTHAEWRKLHEFNAIEPDRIRTPTLLIYGENDPTADAALRQSFFERLAPSDKRLETIPGTDHAAHLEKPDEVSRLIAEYVAAHVH